MKTAATIILATALIFSESPVFAQNVGISTPYLELKNDQIHISYQILNSTFSERFKIWVEVTNTNDELLNATTLAGDYGENVPGGGTKQIIWNYKEDNVSLESGVYVQVFGEQMVPEDASEADTKQEQASETVTAKSQAGQSDIEPVTESVNKELRSTGGAMLRSVVFPGWGLTRVTGMKTHMLKGVAAYAGITSALVFNRLAYNNYEEYKDSNREEELNNLFDKSLRQDNISELSVYFALGVWITDMVWTLVGLSGPDSFVSANSSSRCFAVGTTFNPLYRAPMLALTYRF